jgi:hypothetical protein
LYAPISLNFVTIYSSNLLVLKNFTLLGLALITTLCSITAFAQQQRCVSDQMMQELFKKDPSARARYEINKRQLDEKVKAYLADPNLRQLKPMPSSISRWPCTS